MILRKNPVSFDQSESMGNIYMNRFAIQEEDQFEIHIKQVEIDVLIYEEQMKNAAEEVMLKAQEGSDVYHLYKITLVDGSRLTKFKICKANDKIFVQTAGLDNLSFQ